MSSQWKVIDLFQTATPSRPDQSAWSQMPAQRRVAPKSSSEQNGRTPTPTAPKYRAKRPPSLSWPNNVILKPRKTTTPAPRPTGPITPPMKRACLDYLG